RGMTTMGFTRWCKGFTRWWQYDLTRWWQVSLVLGVLVLLVNLVKAAIRAVARGEVGVTSWTEAVKWAVGTFGAGFLAGLFTWAWGRFQVLERLEWVGAAIGGMLCMLVLCAGYLRLADPELLGPRFFSGGLPILGIGALIGLFFGALIGRDRRKRWAKEGSERRRDGD